MVQLALVYFCQRAGLFTDLHHLPFHSLDHIGPLSDCPSPSRFDFSLDSQVKVLNIREQEYLDGK